MLFNSFVLRTTKRRFYHWMYVFTGNNKSHFISQFYIAYIFHCQREVDSVFCGFFILFAFIICATPFCRHESAVRFSGSLCPICVSIAWRWPFRHGVNNDYLEAKIQQIQWRQYGVLGLNVASHIHILCIYVRHINVIYTKINIIL